jgi:hypothetical protein
MATLKKQTIIASVITAVAGYAVNLWLVTQHRHEHLGSVVIAMGQMLYFVCTIVAILLMVIIKPLRPYINGVWLGTGVNLLIGFALCTTA